tara:strand:- start:664 stop:948 length:285 start_codon:yes stop_codon:yes gene_type:complete
MIRRNIRMRKEYLYSKSQELQEQQKQDRRFRVKNAVDKYGTIPNEYKNEKDAALRDIDLADDQTMIRRSAMDDEYEQAKYRDPKLLITTSRDPS